MTWIRCSPGNGRMLRKKPSYVRLGPKTIAGVALACHPSARPLLLRNRDFPTAPRTAAWLQSCGDGAAFNAGGPIVSSAARAVTPLRDDRPGPSPRKRSVAPERSPDRRRKAARRRLASARLQPRDARRGSLGLLPVSGPSDGSLGSPMTTAIARPEQRRGGVCAFTTVRPPVVPRLESRANLERLMSSTQYGAHKLSDDVGEPACFRRITPMRRAVSRGDRSDEKSLKGVTLPCRPPAPDH